MRALELLRVSGFSSVLDSTEPCDSPAELLEPFAHLLRAALDPRSLSERIAWSVQYCAADLMRRELDAPKVARLVLCRMEERWHLLPLAELPCEKTVAAVLSRMHANFRRKNEGEIPTIAETASFVAPYAGAAPST